MKKDSASANIVKKLTKIITDAKLELKTMQQHLKEFKLRMKDEKKVAAKKPVAKKPSPKAKVKAKGKVKVKAKAKKKVSKKS